MSRAAWREAAAVVLLLLLGALQGLPATRSQGTLQETICWCRSGQPGNTFAVVCEVAALAGGHCSQYYTIITGFIGQFPPGVVESLQKGEFYEARSACPGAELLECHPNQRVVGQAEQDVPRLWNLDQLDSSEDGKYAYGSLGTGVNVYVLDTGVFARHSEFGYPEEDIVAGRFSSDDRRVILGASTIRGSFSPIDCFGHGTMVAGVVAGKTFGVAKNATIISVKTLDCDGVGDVGAVLAALDWVRHNHAKPAIVQMSLATTSADLRLDAAAARLVAEGLTVVASAGNFGMDVDNCSPAREASVIAVGASNIANQPWRSSNYGAGITLFAPGANIISSYKYIAAQGRSFSKSADGIPMAAPHVSGAIALFLQHNPGASPEQVRSQLMRESVEGVLSGVREGTPNILLRVDPKANVPLLSIVGYSPDEAVPDVSLFPGDNATVTSRRTVQVGRQLLNTTTDGALPGLTNGSSTLWQTTPPIANSGQPEAANTSSESTAPLLLDASTERLEPVILFSGGVANHTVTLSNSGATNRSFDAMARLEGIFGGWLAVSPAKGTLPPGDSVPLTLTFVADGLWEGRYRANVEISSPEASGQIKIGVELLNFCSHYETVDADEGLGVTVFTEDVQRYDAPPGWDTYDDLRTGTSEMMWLEVPFQFSHPVERVPPAYVTATQGGVVEVVKAERMGPMCGEFSVRMKIPIDAWKMSSTSVCLSFKEAAILANRSSIPFPEQRECFLIQHKPHARLYAPSLASTGEGLLTSAAEVTIMVAFSKAVDETTLAPEDFVVRGPRGAVIYAITKVHPSGRFWHATLRMNSEYYGAVRVGLRTSVRGAMGQELAPVIPLEFRRDRYVLASPTGYDLLE